MVEGDGKGKLFILWYFRKYKGGGNREGDRDRREGDGEEGREKNFNILFKGLCRLFFF